MSPAARTAGVHLGIRAFGTRVAVAVLLLAALAALGVGCSSPGGPSGGGAAPVGGGATATSAAAGPAVITHATVPPPGSFVTSVVREGLAEPVAVEGEPHRTSDDPRRPPVGILEARQLVLELPPGWRSSSSVLCAWGASEGFYRCMASSASDESGLLTFDVHTFQPQTDDVLELWLMAADTRTGVRRLLAADTASLTWPAALRFAPGYDTVNSVLRAPPPAGGNYLVPR